jgi:hypothetical protein
MFGVAVQFGRTIDGIRFSGERLSFVFVAEEEIHRAFDERPDFVAKEIAEERIGSGEGDFAVVSASDLDGAIRRPICRPDW